METLIKSRCYRVNSFQILLLLSSRKKGVHSKVKWFHNMLYAIALPHLNRHKIESNLSVPGVKSHQENALTKIFEMSPP